MNLGMPEIMIILVIALIVFGPRKLPELGKSLGKAMGQFRRASEDFKRTWEQEVEIEKTRQPVTASASPSSYGDGSNYYNSPNEDGSYSYSSETETGAPADASAPATPAEASGTTASAAASPRREPPRAERWI
jgi:sec-independent protein translocase protein TatA